MSLAVPATIRSMSAPSICWKVGLIVHAPFLRTTRTSLTGPLKGMSLTAKAAAAARQASAVARVALVRAQQRYHHLGVAMEVVVEERADRAVHQAAHEDLPVAGAVLALEEATGETPGGAEFFAVLHLSGAGSRCLRGLPWWPPRWRGGWYRPSARSRCRRLVWPVCPVSRVMVLPSPRSMVLVVPCWLHRCLSARLSRLVFGLISFLVVRCTDPGPVDMQKGATVLHDRPYRSVHVETLSAAKPDPDRLTYAGPAFR
jgi:hypothetical protein